MQQWLRLSPLLPAFVPLAPLRSRNNLLIAGAGPLVYNRKQDVVVVGVVLLSACNHVVTHRGKYVQQRWVVRWAAQGRLCAMHAIATHSSYSDTKMVHHRLSLCSLVKPKTCVTLDCSKQQSTSVLDRCMLWMIVQPSTICMVLCMQDKGTDSQMHAPSTHLSKCPRVLVSRRHSLRKCRRQGVVQNTVESLLGSLDTIPSWMPDLLRYVNMYVACT